MMDNKESRYIKVFKTEAATLKESTEQSNPLYQKAIAPLEGNESRQSIEYLQVEGINISVDEDLYKCELLRSKTSFMFDGVCWNFETEFLDELFETLTNALISQKTVELVSKEGKFSVTVKSVTTIYDRSLKLQASLIASHGIFREQVGTIELSFD